MLVKKRIRIWALLQLAATQFPRRPRRSAVDAVKVVNAALIEGYTQVVDADLSKYFDKIPHDDLMRSLALRVVD